LIEVQRALWRKKLIEVAIVADKNAPPDNLGNYVVSFWQETEDKPRDEMRVRVREVLEGPVLSVLQSSRAIALSSIVLVDVLAYGLTVSLRTSGIKQQTPCAYSQALELASKLIASAGPSHVPTICELNSILFISVFESGSAGAYLVETHHDMSPLVLKILSETDFLLHTDNKMFSFTARLAAMYREMHVLMTIPPHPNIVGPPVALVTIPRADGPAVCGFLSPFHPGGTIACALGRSALDGEPPSLARRIRWAAQMASAIHHLHRVAHTYHGDIKLDNVVLSAQDDAVCIDFEQARHAEGCLAPEAHGAWDIIRNVPAAGSSVNVLIPDPSTIHYVPYAGPERDDTWSAYEAWAMYPEALEALEVYSLGDALQMLFEGMSPPDAVESIVEWCMLEDPTARPRLGLILAELNELVSDV
jgi:hypothetical protein